MSQQMMNLDARLGLDKFEINKQKSHITIIEDCCLRCIQKPCLTVCPAEVYRLLAGLVTLRYENCLECGTCQLACDDLGEGGISWKPPEGGYGIIYRFG